MNNIFPGTIIKGKFPFSDLSNYKIRYLLVLTPPDDLNDIIVAKISTKCYVTKYGIEILPEMLEKSLPHKSMVFCNKIATLKITPELEIVSSMKEKYFCEILEIIKNIFVCN